MTLFDSMVPWFAEIPWRREQRGREPRAGPGNLRSTVQDRPPNISREDEIYGEGELRSVPATGLARGQAHRRRITKTLRFGTSPGTSTVVLPHPAANTYEMPTTEGRQQDAMRQSGWRTWYLAARYGHANIGGDASRRRGGPFASGRKLEAKGQRTF